MIFQISAQLEDASQVLPSEEDLCSWLEIILSHDIFNSLPENAILSITFVDDATMQELNYRYRNIKKSTDILSFTLNEDTPGGFSWGELIISPQQAMNNAVYKNISLSLEIACLLIHGLLHLKGFDHQEDVATQEMQQLEDLLFSLLNRGEKN